MRKTKEDLERLKTLKAERKSLLDERKSAKMHIKEILTEMRLINSKYNKA